MKVLFVVNPNSGRRNEKDMDNKLSYFSSKYGLDHKVLHTEGAADTKRIKSLIEAFQPSTVVAVGGDGTINLVASLLINSGIDLGIVPTGSANGLAYNLNIPNDVEKALENLVDKYPKPLDAILLNEKYHCFHLSDTGINARVVQRFEKDGSKGLAGYGKQLIKEMFSTNSTFEVHIRTNEIQKNIKTEMLVIANAKSFGTGAQINPLGEPDDGKFEIIVIKPYPWWFLYKLIFSFLTGKLHKLQNVKVFSTSEAILTFNKPQDLQNDGEMVEKVTSLKVKIIPGAINVIH